MFVLMVALQAGDAFFDKLGETGSEPREVGSKNKQKHRLSRGRRTRRLARAQAIELSLRLTPCNSDETTLALACVGPGSAAERFSALTAGSAVRHRARFLVGPTRAYSGYGIGFGGPCDSVQ